MGVASEPRAGQLELGLDFRASWSYTVQSRDALPSNLCPPRAPSPGLPSPSWVAVRSLPIGNTGVVDFGSVLRDSRPRRAPDYLYPILSYLSLRLAIPLLTSPSPASADRVRVVRPRRRSDPNCALAEIDHRVLGVLCEHRVVRQDQLGRLFPETPERTLRYRTRRLHELGLAGRSRPYRERGSAPNHHWPTRRADALVCGETLPRGGERHVPNPVFLAHAATQTASTWRRSGITSLARTLGLKRWPISRTLRSYSSKSTFEPSATQCAGAFSGSSSRRVAWTRSLVRACTSPL